MKRNLIAIAIIGMFLLTSTFFVPALGMKASESNTISVTSNDETPTIYRAQVYSNTHDVEWGYTNFLYKFETRNEIGGDVDIEVDFGDGETYTRTDVGGTLWVNHEYSSSGTYYLKARYVGYSSWSESFEFPVVDHCDLEFVDNSVFSDPAKFGKRDTIDIYATVKNMGTVPTTESTSVQFYIGSPSNPNSEELEGPKAVGILAPGEECRVEINDFQWWNDEVTHSIWATIDEVSNEIDWSECGYDDYTNNIADGHFTAPREKSVMFPMLFEALLKLPILREFLGFF